MKLNCLKVSPLLNKGNLTQTGPIQYKTVSRESSGQRDF